MITRNTVLVLGAGASAPYGLPLGPDLVNKVVNIPEKYTLHRDDLQSFIHNLRESTYLSVDAYLERYPEFMSVGKWAIAAALLPEEAAAKLHPPNNRNWYQQLADATDLREEGAWQKNRLTIITFNYDRTLEEYIARALRANFGMSVKESLSVLGEIPIIHVHGSLGPLHGDNQTGVYGLSPISLDIPVLANEAMNHITIVSEARPESNEFQVAREAITSASRIFVLGLGFNKANLGRIGLIPYEGSDSLVQQETDVIATKYRIPSIDWDFLEHELPWPFAAHGVNILRMLTEVAPLVSYRD